LCTATYAYASEDPTATTRILPPKGSGAPPENSITAGGETFATATVIPALPYNDAGNTCNAVNNVTPSCALSNAPDVFYSYTPAANTCVNISLCGSTYDTMIGVYNAAFVEIGCNDDFCGLQSSISNVALAGGQTYYIMIDGYNLSCGDYTLSVTVCPPPPMCDPCTPLGIAEGEPTCADGYIDVTNGGCNSVPPVTTNLICQPSMQVCGTYGTFNANGTRDTDWYQFTVNAPTVINVSANGMGNTGTALAILDTACPPTVLCGSFTASGVQCSNSVCSAAVGAGTYRVFVASFFDNTPCGSPYVLNISGLTCPPTDVQASSWMLKTLYR
jgi:hypothetical protein